MTSSIANDTDLEETESKWNKTDCLNNNLILLDTGMICGENLELFPLMGKILENRATHQSTVVWKLNRTESARAASYTLCLSSQNDAMPAGWELSGKLWNPF